MKTAEEKIWTQVFDWLMSGSLMSHNFKTIDFAVMFATNLFVPAISANTFVSAIIHNTFATIPLSTIPYTDIPLQEQSGIILRSCRVSTSISDELICAATW